MSADGRWMEYAARLGRRALGSTSENPPVGCVIVKEDHVLGIGWTQPGGRPHAETEALAMAGAEAKGATAYVTLEPCAHHGRTPPCADALAAAGIARVVSALTDPNPRAGAGHAILKRAGIEVETGVGADLAQAELAGFFTRIASRRPYVILKLALSLDGKIAGIAGKRTDITGPEARSRVHLMRAQCDAILVGMGTVVADDPELTCRLPGMEWRSPRPFVLSEAAHLPPASKLAARRASILRGGLMPALADLAEQGINRLMVEGGAITARSFIESRKVDEIHLFRSSHELGAEGLDALAGLGLETALAQFRLTGEEVLGQDRLAVYEKLRANPD